MVLRSDFIDVRAQRRLRELERFIYAFEVPIKGWKLSNTWLPHIARPDAVGKLDQDVPAVSAELVDIPSFPHVAAKTFWASANVQIPAELSGKRVYARLATNSECTVYVNGKVSGGLDVNRQDILLTESASAGEMFQLDLMVFSGREREARTVTASLVTFNDSIYQFRHDLRAAIGVARTFDVEHPTGILLWRCVENALNAIDFHNDYTVPNVAAAAEMLQSKIAKLAETHPPADLHFYLCGNSHIDVTWLWTFAETRQKMIRTTSTALKYMDELPEYHFAQSQAQLYDFLRQDNPELFEKVKQRAAQGQWEYIGGAWVEPDCNITGGESLVRQMLYGQKFWKEHFGKHSETMWLVDTFGYASAMPQILKKTGLTTFVTQKLTWSETNKFPFSHFDWEGIDGTRIRCVFAQTYVSRTFPEEIINYYKTYPSRDVTPDFLYLYGYGDGGGGPVREDVELGKRLKSMPLYPQCEFSRVEDALTKLKASADNYAAEYGYDIPVWKGELYLEFHRGTLTTHAAVKRSNRKSEFLLREAEIWASLAHVQNGADYPAELLETAWKKVLLNQFHDILPGTSIPEVYPDVHQLYAEVHADVEGAIAKILPQQPASQTFTVLNSLSFAVTDWAEFSFEGSSNIHLTDASGAVVAHQLLSEENGIVKIGIEATVPAMSSSTYTIQSGALPKALNGDVTLEASLEKALSTWEQSESDLVRLYLGMDLPPMTWDEIGAAFDMGKSEMKDAKTQVFAKLAATDKSLKEKSLNKLRDLNKNRHSQLPKNKVISANADRIKNKFFKVQFDENGQITSIFDKKRNREWLAGMGNQLQTFEDRPNHWDAWDVNDWYEQKPLNLLQLTKAEAVEVGNLRSTIRFEYATPNGSTVIQDVCLYRSIPRIDFKTKLDWREQHVLLKAAFPVAVHASHATYEIQYGSIERPTSRNTTWEAAKFEVSGHKWTDLSEGNGGVSLLNDGKYGHDIFHNVMRISLLRTPTHPDPQAPSPPYWFLDDPNVFTDQGTHETNYSFFPHDGDWRNGTVNQGFQVNQPLRVVQGDLNLVEIASIDNNAVHIEALKRAEDGNGFIVRCYEAHGSRGEVSLKLPFRIASAEAVDMLERPTTDEEAPMLEDGKMDFHIAPYEIRTFRVTSIE